MDTKKPAYRSSRAVAFGADNGARTRDPNLGKVVLYQLSHSRILLSPYLSATIIIIHKVHIKVKEIFEFFSIIFQSF